MASTTQISTTRYLSNIFLQLSDWCPEFKRIHKRSWKRDSFKYSYIQMPSEWNTRPTCKRIIFTAICLEQGLRPSIRLVKTPTFPFHIFPVEYLTDLQKIYLFCNLSHARPSTQHQIREACNRKNG